MSIANNSDPPLPLEMSDKDADQSLKHLYDRLRRDGSDVRDRLLVEILDALRRIDDKLAKLLER